MQRHGGWVLLATVVLVTSGCSSNQFGDRVDVTGTVKLKANFENSLRRLWPGQFVNVRVELDIRKDGTVIPAAAVQRNASGPFAYVVGPDDKLELRFHKEFPQCLMRNYSPMRYEEPFFYGNFRNHVAIFMFDRTEGIRFTHSPSGGGGNAKLQTTNPAWDFQYLVPKYEVKREYRFRTRLAYRPRCSRDDILQEVAAWRKTLK